MIVHFAKTADLVEMPLTLVSVVGPRNSVLDGEWEFWVFYAID